MNVVIYVGLLVVHLKEPCLVVVLGWVSEAMLVMQRVFSSRYAFIVRVNTLQVSVSAKHTMVFLGGTALHVPHKT